MTLLRARFGIGFVEIEIILRHPFPVTIRIPQDDRCGRGVCHLKRGQA